jgi:hypothetical protein
MVTPKEFVMRGAVQHRFAMVLSALDSNLSRSCHTPTDFIEKLEKRMKAFLSRATLAKFGMEGLKLAPATSQDPGTGHHHLLIDQKELPDASVPIPATDTVIHYGKAQTETELTLSPGKHTLQLVAGDKLHMQFNPTVASKVITVNVK